MQVTEIILTNNPSSVYSNNINFEKDQPVVISNNGSLELGTVKGTTSIDNNDEITIVDVIRAATADDLKMHCENCKYARTLLPEIKVEAEKLNLDMKVGFIAVNLDKTKIVVNYTSDTRVDFRDLVKILGAKYKARIEMRQIGFRDETKVVGAIGMCGRVTCCKAFLSDFDKVSIKMAKNQNIALNPNRINGMCGRLLCCFKYEDEFYEEMKKKMPKNGSFVNTPDGQAEVTSTDYLKETVTVCFKKDEDSVEMKTFDLKDISKN